MAEIPMDLRSSHREEADGSHTVTITMSGIPSLQMAQGVSNWMRSLVRSNAHQIGRLDTKTAQPASTNRLGPTCPPEVQ